MVDPTKSYYLRLTAAMSHELRLRSVQSGQTMNAVIVTALRRYLDAMKAASSDEPAAVEPNP